MTVDHWIAVIGVILSLGQFVTAILVSSLRRKFDELKTADAALGERMTVTQQNFDQRISQLEILVAGRYITRDESIHAREEMGRHMNARFDRLESILAGKVDRGDCIRIHEQHNKG